MKRRILLVTLGLLLVTAGVWLVATLYWRGRYQAEIERIRAAGHPVLPSDVVVPECPDEENMLPVLKSAAEEFEALANERPELRLRGFNLFDPDRKDGLVTEAEARAALDVLGPYFARIESATHRSRLVVGLDDPRPRAFDFDLATRLLVRSQLQPECSLPDARRLLCIAAALEPTAWEQAATHFTMVERGLDLLRAGVGRGEAADDALLTALRRVDPIRNFRSMIDLNRVEGISAIEVLESGEDPFAGVQVILDAAPDRDWPNFTWIGRLRFRIARPALYWWATTFVEDLSAGIQRFESARGDRLGSGSETFDGMHRVALTQLRGLRIARVAAAISRDGVPPAELPEDPLTGESIECVKAPDGYRIGDDWFVPTRP